MTESEWQAQVCDLARTMGWKVTHFGTLRTAKSWATPVRYDGKGFPDLVLVHPERAITMFRELKGAKTPLTAEQVRWGQWLTAAGADWAVWRPSDWHTVAAVLTGGRALLPLEGKK